MTYLNHLTECGKMPIACPNNCGEVIFRESMTGHRLELSRCKHSKEGCKEMIRRKEHLNDHVYISNVLYASDPSILMKVSFTTLLVPL